MLDELTAAAGPEFVSAALWTLLALLILVVVLVIVRVVRGMTFGTFVAGGRNRKTRLAVMDATAVDSQRRLVLVRRDDVEHLILIGGPTDVVVEQHIRFGQQQRRPAQEQPFDQAAAPQRAAAEPAVAAAPPAQQRQPAQPQRPPAPPREPQRAPAAAPRITDRPPQPAPVARSADAKPPLRAVPPPPARAEPSLRDTTRDTYLPRDLQSNRPAAPPARNVSANDLDKALVDELNVSLEESKPAAKELSLEDEMNKLLGELTSKRQA
jgi:flagellar biogenesis protein FliO